MTKKKLWILPVSLAVVGLILFLIWWLLGSKGTAQRVAQGTKNGAGTTTSDPIVLRYGDRGEDVKIIQAWLNIKTPHVEGATLLFTDGIFGKKTEAALYAITKTKEVRASLLIQARKDLGLQ